MGETPELTLTKLVGWEKQQAASARKAAKDQRSAGFAACLWDAAWHEDAARCLEEAASEIERLNAEVAVRDRALESMGLALASEYGVCSRTEQEQRVVVADYVRIHTATARAELEREQEAADGDH